MTTVLPAHVGQAGASHRPSTSVLLHLVPGAVALLAYVGLAPLAAAVGLPSVAALAAVGLVVVPGVQLGILGVHNRRRPGEPAVALRTRLPLPRVVGWALLEIVLAVVAFAATTPLTQLLKTHVFGWWPQTWTIRLGTDDQYSDQALLITAVLLLVGTVIVAPVVEEVFFRGCLLPRMPQQFGPLRTPAHVGLFAAYHLWSPWLMPTRVLAILPLAYIAARTGDLRIGVITHIVLNATDLIVLLLYLRAH